MRLNGHRLTLKELPEDERPREKIHRLGPESLSNAELLAIILRTGTMEDTAVQLAQSILAHFGGLQPLVDATIEELSRVKGIGLAKAAEIKAATELGRRLLSLGAASRVVIKEPEDVGKLLMPEMRYLTKEHFKVVLLNTKNHVLGIKTVSVGSLNASIVHPRELFKEAIKRSSAAVILAHNHPSGDPSPSGEDIAITRRLCEAGKVLDITVLDHVIIGDGKYVSLKDKGII